MFGDNIHGHVHLKIPVNLRQAPPPEVSVQQQREAEERRMVKSFCVCLGCPCSRICDVSSDHAQSDMKCPAEDARHYLTKTKWNMEEAREAYLADMSEGAKRKHMARYVTPEVDDDIHIIIDSGAFGYGCFMYILLLTCAVEWQNPCLLKQQSASSALTTHFLNYELSEE